MAPLNELAQGFGFVETMARSLALKEAQAPDPAKLRQYYLDNPAARPRAPGVPPPPPPGGPGGGPVVPPNPIPPPVRPPPNPTQLYASPGDPKLLPQGGNPATHKPWGQSLPAMPAGWDPNSTRFYGSYAKNYPNWRQNHAGPDGILGNRDDNIAGPRSGGVPFSKADLWRNMNIQIASMRQADRASTGQPALELASKAYAEPTRAEYEGRFSKFRHPGDSFYSRTQQARDVGSRPLNKAGPGAAMPPVPYADNAAVTTRQGNLRTSGRANRLAQQTYGKTNYPDVYNNVLGGSTPTRWPYHGPTEYITPGGYDVNRDRVIPQP